MRQVLGGRARHRRVAHINKKGALVHNPRAAGRGAKDRAAGRGAVVRGHILLAGNDDPAGGNLLVGGGGATDGPGHGGGGHSDLQ